MFIFLIALHVIVCLALIAFVLLQQGDGGGIAGAFGGGMAESFLGAKASSFLTKSTTIFAVLFFVICISLTALTAKKTQSIFDDAKMAPSQQQVEESAATAESAGNEAQAE
jgi:preprotein translocase subunit SecG